MSCAACSAAYVWKRARATPFAWIRESLPWPRTSAKIFSIPAICCLVMICQPTSPKGRHRVTERVSENQVCPGQTTRRQGDAATRRGKRFPAFVAVSPCLRVPASLKVRGHGADTRNLRQYCCWRAGLLVYDSVVWAGGLGAVQ